MRKPSSLALIFAAVILLALIGFAAFLYLSGPEDGSVSARLGLSSAAPDEESLDDSSASAGPDGRQMAESEVSEAPAEPAEELKRLSTPPESSVWALPADSYDEGASLTVVFEPYGYGPDAMGESVAVSVLSAKSGDSSKRTPDIAGKNVVLILGETQVEQGGCYEATVVLRPSGNRLVLKIEHLSVQPKQ